MHDGNKSASDAEESAVYDFNQLERRAKELIKAGRSADAIKIYLFMADGDQSLDGGYLGSDSGSVTRRSVTCMPPNTGTGARLKKIPK